MMTKYVDKIIWNKDSTKEYQIGTDADNIFIDTEFRFTVKDFFYWVRDFFENGNFIYTGEEEPQSLQTIYWYDTNDFSNN